METGREAEAQLTDAERALVEAVQKHHNEVHKNVMLGIRDLTDCGSTICAALSAFLAERGAQQQVKCSPEFEVSLHQLVLQLPGLHKARVEFFEMREKVREASETKRGDATDATGPETQGASVASAPSGPTSRAFQCPSCGETACVCAPVEPGGAAHPNYHDAAEFACSCQERGRAIAVVRLSVHEKLRARIEKLEGALRERACTAHTLGGKVFHRGAGPEDCDDPWCRAAAAMLEGRDA